MAKRMLADVLWEAANEHLMDERLSCCAVARACGIEWGRTCNLHDAAQGSPVFDFLANLGCTTRSYMFFNLAEDPAYDALGARYMWLLLAMHVAEDEGIEL